MTNCELKRLLKIEETTKFDGWNFSYLKDRWEAEDLPWNYKDIVEQYLKPQYRLLDMGTGGGEFLLSLNHPYHNTSVTEMWEPNVLICKRTLSPLGIDVKQVFCDDNLPFSNSSFDMIINRHESYDIKEVKRILKPNGIFIIQQVGDKNNENLSKKLIKNFKPMYKNINLMDKVQEMKTNDFEVLYAKEYFPYLRFYDVGALVYFAKVIEWEFPNFSVDNNFKQLCELNKELEHTSYIEGLEHRFIIVCKNIK